METQLTHFDTARREIALAKSIDEVKQIRDKAEALQHYIRQQGASLEMQNECAEIKLRAERRAGVMLTEMERHKQEDGRPEKALQDVTHNPTLDDLGISRIQSHRWQLEASVPEPEFEQHVAKTKAKGEELTSAGLRRQALKGKYSFQKDSNAISIPEGRFRTITIDPPWPVEKILRDVRPNQLEFGYKTMTIEEIKLMPIPDLAYEDGTHIYLWTTHKYVRTAFDILDSWGAKYECLLTWVKNVGFTPFSWMYSTEHCLFARIGSLPLLKKGKRVDIQAKAREHSRKPDEFYNLVKEVSPEPRLDIFSREEREGFKSYGDETRKFNS